MSKSKYKEKHLKTLNLTFVKLFYDQKTNNRVNLRYKQIPTKMTTENVLRFPQKPKGQSKLAEKIGFFTTARGVHFSHKFMTAAVAGVGAAFWSYDQFFLNRYINFVRAYR